MKKIELDGSNNGATRAQVKLNLHYIFKSRSGVVSMNMHEGHAKNQRGENLASRPHRNKTLMMHSATT
jgi:hypothetical protein